MHLTADQRLDWLEVRIGELELWIAREWIDLEVCEPFGDRGRVTVVPPPGWALDTERDLLERPLGAPRTELDSFAVRTWSLRPTSSPP